MMIAPAAMRAMAIETRTILSELPWARLARAALAAALVAAAADMACDLVERRATAMHDLLIAAVLFGSALLSSIAGFAFSAIAGSALAWLQVDPLAAVRLMAVCSIAMQSYAVWSLRRDIRWRELVPMMASGAVMVPVGIWLLMHARPGTYAGGLGVFLTLYGGYLLLLRRSGRRLEGARWQETLVGALGGVAGGAAGLPGAFLTVWCAMRGWTKVEQRAVYQPFILVMQLVTFGWLSLLSTSTMPSGGAADLRYVPFALLGAVGGLAVFRRLSTRQFTVVVSLLLVLSGMGLLVRTLR
jgi:uncharacterized membrane protein YfcA